MSGWGSSRPIKQKKGWGGQTEAQKERSDRKARGRQDRDDFHPDEIGEDEGNFRFSGNRRLKDKGEKKKWF